MLFFFKKKKLVLDCFTKNPGAYELFQIDYAKKFYPEWWKSLPPTIQYGPEKSNKLTNGGSMRQCPGIVDYYQHGVIMPLWTEINFEIGPIGSTTMRVAMADPTSDGEQHPHHQRGTYLPPEHYSHLKINTPWVFRCSKAVQFLMIKPIWNYDKPEQLIIPPGSLNFYYQHTTNVNLFVKHQRDNSFFSLDAGIPLVHIIPLTEEKLEIKNHLVSAMEYQNIIYPKHKFAFTSAYYKYKKMKMHLDGKKEE